MKWISSNSIVQSESLYIKFTIIILSIFTLNGCAPGLGTSINLNAVSKAEFEHVPPLNSGSDQIRLNVLSFIDNRSIEAIAQIDGRLIKPEGDAALAAQKIFEAMAKEAGIKLTLFNSPAVRGEIREWRVVVTPAFPSSKVEAIASVRIDLLDRDSQVIHSATYSGNFQEENPFLNDSKVQTALGKAMSYAIGEVFKDNIFTSRLNSAANISNELNY